MIEIMSKSSGFFFLLINDIFDFFRFEIGGFVLDVNVFKFFNFMCEVENIVCFLVVLKRIFLIFLVLWDFLEDVLGDCNCIL